jgi:outer membrane immunogenic protein
MNRIFTGAMVGLLALAGASGAVAADMGHKGKSLPAPAPAAAPVESRGADNFNWSGIYFGVDGGYGNSSSNFNYTSTGHTVSLNPRGSVFGIHGGIRRQSGNLVVGIDANADIANFSGTTSCPNPFFDCTTKIDGLESVRAVLGVASGRVLYYGTAGLGFEQVEHDAVDTTSGRYDRTKQLTKSGWVAGGGVETMLTQQVSIGAQYLHYGFVANNGDFVQTATGKLGGNADFRESADVFTARLNFKLTGPEDHVPLK